MQLKNSLNIFWVQPHSQMVQLFNKRAIQAYICWLKSNPMHQIIYPIRPFKLLLVHFQLKNHQKK